MEQKAFVVEEWSIPASEPSRLFGFMRVKFFKASSEFEAGEAGGRF